MNAERFIRIFGNIRDEHINEATAAKKNSRSAIKITSAAAACLALLVGAYVGLTAPQADPDFVIKNGVLLSYKGSETEVAIPETVSTVSKDAFSGEAALKIVKLSAEKDTKFEDGALSKLKYLECIEITNATENEFKDFVGTIFSCDAEELVSRGIGLKYEYTKDGGTPIYSVTNCEGVSIAFAGGSVGNPLSGDETPINIRVTSPLSLNGLSVGMSPSDVKKQNIEWDNAYFTCDFLGYYSVKVFDGVKYTVEWSMSEEQYNEWVLSLGLSDNFENAKEKYLAPYVNETMGDIVAIVIENEAKR